MRISESVTPRVSAAAAGNVNTRPKAMAKRFLSMRLSCWNGLIYRTLFQARASGRFRKGSRGRRHRPPEACQSQVAHESRVTPGNSPARPSGRRWRGVDRPAIQRLFVRRWRSRPGGRPGMQAFHASQLAPNTVALPRAGFPSPFRDFQDSCSHTMLQRQIKPSTRSVGSDIGSTATLVTGLDAQRTADASICRMISA